MAKASTGKPAATKKTTTSVAKAGPTTRKKATPAAPGLAPAGALARPTTRCKFTLFNLLGQPRAYYLVEPIDLPREPAGKKKNAVAHSVIVVDRSGSMYGAIGDTKDTLLQL